MTVWYSCICPRAQSLFGKKGKVGMVEVAALCKNCPISDIVNQIGGRHPLRQR